MYGTVVIVSWAPFGSHHCPLVKRVAKDNCTQFKKNSYNDHAHVLECKGGRLSSHSYSCEYQLGKNSEALYNTSMPYDERHVYLNMSLLGVKTLQWHRTEVLRLSRARRFRIVQ